MEQEPCAVTFDFGQTLTELDCDLLSARLAERGAHSNPDALQAALPEAWRVYDAACATSAHPWQLLMTTILVRGGVAGGAAVHEALVEWLWSEQPRINLWRRPIPGMIELVRSLNAAGVKVAVISNSEGRLAELAEELGWRDEFLCIADSGLIGVAKPAPEIFEWTGRFIGVLPSQFVHVGDSWTADVEGILALGGRAVWFGGASIAPEPPEGAQASDKVQLCRSASEVRDALRVFGLPL